MTVPVPPAQEHRLDVRLLDRLPEPLVQAALDRPVALAVRPGGVPMSGSLFTTRSQQLALLRAKTKPFGSVRPVETPPLCGVVIHSSWHEPVACAYPPDHGGGGVHSWASIPALPPGKARMTKKEAGIRLAIIAGEIRLTLDETDPDCPSWADDLDRIAGWLHPGGTV